MNAARVVALVVVLVLASTLLVGLAASHEAAGAAAEPDAYPGHTLIGVQAVGWFGNNNGYAAVVAPNGSVVWRWSVPNSRVFDVEHLPNGNVLASVAVVVPNADCPQRYQDRTNREACVHNRVVEIDYETKTIVWEYDWYDAFPTHHEVHDADRLSTGETAIIDMGNDRAFTVNEAGEVTWRWNATDHIAQGTPWFEEHVPGDKAEAFTRSGSESDWTHMNDIDRLSNGHFTLSIRNFDVVLEVDRSGTIVETYGTPDDHTQMNEQHNPNLLEEAGTLLVADSENDRIVELDAETGKVVWTYERVPASSGVEPATLRWPRDADRLPNGNTLITDSRRFRVLEVTPNGSVAWSFDSRAELGRRAIIYEADRIRLTGEHLPEEPDVAQSGGTLTSRTGGPLVDAYATLDSWLSFILPAWMGPLGLVVALGDVTAALLLARELR
ncbi:aryl-sulfate sulfotransferase [Halosegnis sp.]|uniref:aryl-sulfate sulfotransferase n=1 Tax=Halosegnis sp. TaxID=2864959 RepID=UPI0035D4BD18